MLRMLRLAPPVLTVPLPHRLRLGKGDAKIGAQRLHDGSGDRLHILLNPFGVLQVVVVGHLNQDGGRIGLQDLGQIVGGAGVDPLGQRVDLLHLLDHDVGKALAEQGVLAVAGAVVDVDAAQQPLHPLGRRVGVQGDVHAVAGHVGEVDRIHHCAVRVVAHKLDPAGLQIGFHGIGDAIHPVFLVAVVDIKIVLLRGGT